MKQKQIHGILMRPVSTNQEDHKETMHSTRHSVSSKFLSTYNDHIAAMEIVASCAKIFILENYQKVTDWSDLEVTIRKGKEETSYYKFKPHRFICHSEGMKKLMEERDAKKKANENIATSVTDAVLDTSDGDFSITINGKEHWWLSDDEVICIADYIERSVTNL